MIKLLLLLLLTISNCAKIPKYLSITADTEIARMTVLNFIQKSLQSLIEVYDDDKMKEDYYNHFESGMNNEYHEPDSWHTTCLYIGNDSTKIEGDLYKKFVEGVDVILSSYVFVYSPKRIMISPVNTQGYNLIENKYPHVTLLLGDLRAVDSNYVLRYIFEQTSTGKEIRQEKNFNDKDYFKYDKYKHAEIQFDDIGKSGVLDEIYILKFNHQLILNGKTMKNY